jgi:hypothetical protein
MGNEVAGPSAQLWWELYRMADLFWEQKPWEIFDNEMIIGVEDPVSKQVGWCSVMGSGGMEFGLCVHRGARGFKGLVAMLSDVDPDDILPLIDSINLSFEHSDFLESRDLEVIKDLGISPRYHGTQRWPRFRAYLPQRKPWFLSADEALFLKTAVEQVLVVARSSYEDPAYFANAPADRFLVRAAQSSAKGEAEWRNDYRRPELYTEPTPAAIEISRSQREKITSLPVRKDFVIEADLFLPAMPICDSEPPWLPWMMMALDVQSDYVFPPQGMEKDCDPVVMGSRQLIAILEGLNHRPAKIRMKHEKWYRYFEKPCAELCIELEKATSLPALKKARDSFREYMRWDKDILGS